MPTALRRWSPVILATLCLTSSISSQNSNEPRHLEVGKPVERELAGGEVHSYLVTLAAGQFMQAVVDQRGIDVVVSLYGPDGKKISEVDSPNGADGPEPMSSLARAPGDYRIEVSSLEKNAATGRYEVKVEAVRAATPKDTAEDLASALSAVKTEQERNVLLAERTDLITVELRNALIKKGLSLETTQSDYPRALSLYQMAQSVAEQAGDTEGIALALIRIGTIRLSQANYAQASEYYQKSLMLSEALGNQPIISTALNGMGILYHSQGNYALALEYYQKALRHAEVVGDKRKIAVVLSNIGNIYGDQGNYAQSLEYDQRALSLVEEIGNKSLMSVYLMNIGFILGRQGNYDQALSNFEKSLSLQVSIGHKGVIAAVLSNIGLIHLSQGNYAQAAEYYKKALAQFEAMGDKEWISYELIGLGEAYRLQGNYASALEFAERAATTAKKAHDFGTLWQSLTTVGRAHRALNQPIQAHRVLVEAIAAIETLRSQVAGGEQEQQRFLENKVAPYQEMVELLVSQNDAVQALAYAERVKARVLLDVLHSGRVNVNKAMTQPEKEQERKLESELVSLNTQITRTSRRPQPDQARLADLKSRLEKTRLDYEAFQTNLYAAHPQLKTQRGEVQPIKLEEVSTLLPDSNTAALEFVVTEDKTYLFVLTKNGDRSQAPVGLKVYTLPVKQKDLADRSERFRQQIAKGDLDFQGPARELYDLLLKPAQSQLQGKTTLVIVPDDVLWNLPFQALQPTANHYVIENQALFYTPSLTVLREMLKTHGNQVGKPSTSTLLAFGNPAVNKQTAERVQRVLMDEKLEPLPEAEKQVTALKRLYGPAQSRVYIGADAREDRAKTEAGGYRMLQFATHGILNDRSPMYSHIVLSQAEGDSNEDGLLEAWEMMNLDLHADMVVLSACETARGRVGAGEGIIGMSWALFVAGAPTTVVSQWKVESASTTELMLAFHRNLKAGMQNPKSPVSKAKALQQASIKLLRSSKYSHPFYWAGFVVVGDGF